MQLGYRQVGNRNAAIRPQVADEEPSQRITDDGQHRQRSPRHATPRHARQQHDQHDQQSDLVKLHRVNRQRRHCTGLDQAEGQVLLERQAARWVLHARHDALAAEAAAGISARFYRENLTISIKDDRSPVTDADVACEQAIRRIILEAFPDHGFYGEETGRNNADSEYTWLVDPIDGTKGFIREYPFFSTQIALMHQGEIIVGVSCAAMMNELACAERGAGAWLPAS